MRVPVPLVFLAIGVAAPVGAASVEPIAPGGAPAAKCPRTTTYLADAGGIYRGAPLTPKKLDQLPPGTTYMAVYRRIDGCDAPLTMVEYRNPHRR